MHAAIKQREHLVTCEAYTCLSVPNEIRDAGEAVSRRGIIVLLRESGGEQVSLTLGEYRIRLGRELVTAQVLKVLETEGYVSGIFEVSGQDSEEPF